MFSSRVHHAAIDNGRGMRVALYETAKREREKERVDQLVWCGMYGIVQKREDLRRCMVN